MSWGVCRLENRDKSLGEELERILEGYEYIPLTLEFSEGMHLLLHPLRRALFIFLLYHPCESLADIGRHFNKKINTLKWHINILMDAGFVECFDQPGKRKRYYVKGYLSQSDVTALSCLGNKRERDFYRVVTHNPGITLKDIAQEIGALLPSVVRLKNELKNAGLIDTVKAGRYLLVYPTDLIKKRIEHFTYDDSDLISAIMTILRKDGMMPELVSKTKDRIKISVQGIDKRYVITVPRNPYRHYLELLSR